MHNTTFSTDERISALVDSCLDGDDLAPTMTELLGNAQATQTWHAYHVVGDILRSTALAPKGDEFDFLKRLEDRLALEPGRPPVVPGLRLDTGKDSANARVFHWRLIAGVACVAVAGVVSLSSWSPSTTQNLAQSPVPPVAVSMPQLAGNNVDAGVMIRDPALDELMAEHRQFGGHSALQMPAGFLRNATYEGVAR